MINQLFPFLWVTDTRNDWVTYLSCPESREKKWKWFVTQLKVKNRAEKSIQSKVSASFKLNNSSYFWIFFSSHINNQSWILNLPTFFHDFFLFSFFTTYSDISNKHGVLITNNKYSIFKIQNSTCLNRLAAEDIDVEILWEERKVKIY